MNKWHCREARRIDACDVQQRHWDADIKRLTIYVMAHAVELYYDIERRK